MELLDDDGRASMATAFMMSHHAFRRDLALFARALAAADREGKAAALHEEWKAFTAKLHGHHTVEDQQMFPGLRAQHPSLAVTIDRLTADHGRLGPLLAQGQQCLAQAPVSPQASAVVGELIALLDPHLAIEEAEVVPFLRASKTFPAPATDAEADLYAQGFAWASQGIAPEVLEQVDAMLPELLRVRLPAARAAFDASFRRLWGDPPGGRSRTPIPDWLDRR
jgi:hypothetical protein